MNESEPINLPLDVRTITPIRCDLSTHCDMSVRVQRQERSLKQNPGITIKTDAERVATIVRGLAKPPGHTEITSNEPAIDVTEDTGISKKRRWELAVSKVVTIAGRLTQTEAPDVVGHNIVTLFDGLRDPDRRERTMERVEVLYKEHVSTTRR